MGYRLKLSDVGKMTDEELLAAIEEMRRNPSPVSDIDDRILEFEKAYEMSSDEMQRQLNNNEIRETADICNWLMLLHTRNRIVKKD
jgi:hypothetical protein